MLVWLEDTSALPCDLDRTMLSSSPRLRGAEQRHLPWVPPAVDTPVLARSGPQQHAQNWTVGLAAPLCSSAVTPKVWEAPGLQWDNTSVQKGLNYPREFGYPGTATVGGEVVLANCPLLCGEDDLLGSYCYGLLAGSVAESTAGVGRMAFLKSPGAADSAGVSNICLPPAHKVCLKQL